MNYNKSALAVAIAAALGGASTAADAAVHNVTLTGILTYSNNGSSAADVSSSTATFHYDDATNVVTQTAGLFEHRVSIVPNVSTLFRHSITGLIMGNGAAATATTFVCTEGNFGPIINASSHLCGNYNFGGDFINDSSTTWGPGLAFDRTIGGNDMAVGAQQNISLYNGMNSAGIVGTALTVSNATTCGTCATPNAGYSWTFTTDADADATENSLDNCWKVANANQADSDADGYGNRCDGDMNQNLVTNSQDYVLFRAQLGAPSVAPVYNKADINSNAVVNSQDYVLFRGLLGSPPGPGVAP
jgi:hypothetical protein